MAECADGQSTLEAIATLAPEIVFLDISMPELTGFEVLRSLPPERVPLVVFVTAYEEHALEAFEVHAVDYLLKPIVPARFEDAWRRARARLGKDESPAKLGNQVLAVLERLAAAPNYAKNLVVKSRGRVMLVPTDTIHWIEAAGKYVRLHTGRDYHLLREPLNCLEARLDPQVFVRIHRSTIVNTGRIKELEPTFHGDFVVRLLDGTQLAMSRSHRERLETLLGTSL